MDNPKQGLRQYFSPVLGHRVHALIGGDMEAKDQIVMIHGALASHRYLMPTVLEFCLRICRYSFPYRPDTGRVRLHNTHFL